MADLRNLDGVAQCKYRMVSADENLSRDPVSEVDHRVETLIRTRLAERFPEHDVIGEEMDERSQP
jgi:myo-inositol-1(or 4)-monophosphatase